MQDKEALVRLHAFPPPPIFYGTKYEPGKGTAHTLVTKDHVGKARFTSLLKKYLGLTCKIFGFFVYCGIGIQIALPPL